MLAIPQKKAQVQIYRSSSEIWENCAFTSHGHYHQQIQHNMQHSSSLGKTPSQTKLCQNRSRSCSTPPPASSIPKRTKLKRQLSEVFNVLMDGWQTVTG